MTNEAFILTAPRAITTPPTGTPKLTISGDVFTITSDTFSGSAATTVSGRSTDALAGGSAMAWSATAPTAWGISGGALVPGSAPQTSVLTVSLSPTRAADVTVSVKVNTVPNATMYLIARRDTQTSPTNQLRLVIGAGTVTLGATVGGSVVDPANSSFAYTAGDVLGLRENAGVVEMLKNGVVQKTFSGLGTFTGHLAGFSCGAGATSFSYDDFKVISKA